MSYQAILFLSPSFFPFPPLFPMFFTCRGAICGVRAPHGLVWTSACARMGGAFDTQLFYPKSLRDHLTLIARAHGKGALPLGWGVFGWWFKPPPARPFWCLFTSGRLLPSLLVATLPSQPLRALPSSPSSFPSCVGPFFKIQACYSHPITSLS